MNDRCTATLTTAAIEPCPDVSKRPCSFATYPGHPVCDGYWHAILHEFACTRHEPHHKEAHWRKGDGGYVEWTDSTPGATPHQPPLVTDAEVEAAARHLLNGIATEEAKEGVRGLLEAAARVRQEADR